MLISEEYKALLAQKHAESDKFGTSGFQWAPRIHEWAKRTEARQVLDYGCGKGTLKASLERFPIDYKVLEYDPAVPGKEYKPIRADLVVCGDVLEHIEPDCIDDVLDDIRRIARVGVFLVVATRPAKKHLADGRNAHLIIEPVLWWLPKLLDRWELKHFSDAGGEFVFEGAKK